MGIPKRLKGFVAQGRGPPSAGRHVLLSNVTPHPRQLHAVVDLGQQPQVAVLCPHEALTIGRPPAGQVPRSNPHDRTLA